MPKIFNMCCNGSGVKEDANTPQGSPMNKLTGAGRLPVAELHPDWLDRPFSNFQVACSHNTYLSGLQFGFTAVSTQGVVNALAKGARAIELDVFCADFEKGDFKPVVAHGNEIGENKHLKVTNGVPFEDFIKCIAEHGWVGTDDPLFLMIENCTCKSAETGNMMVDIVKKHFPAGRFMSPRTPIAGMPLKDLIGKLVILNGRDSAGAWDSFWTMAMGGDYMANISSTDGPDKVDPARITRVYPPGDLERLFSHNFDIVPFGGKATFLALNWQTDDKHLQELLKTFKNCSFALKIV